MEEESKNQSDRFINMLGDVSEKVEAMRRKALTIQGEREEILELLQDMQDYANRRNVSQEDIDDIETSIERMILRCLTVEVSVSTPRNEFQEEAYHSVTEIIEDLQGHLEENPQKYAKTVEGYLNACLPDPLSHNVDTRFQSKVLGCTIDDQKRFRKKLQSLHRLTQKQHVFNGQCSSQDTEQQEVGEESQNDKSSSCSADSVNSVNDHSAHSEGYEGCNGNQQSDENNQSGETDSDCPETVKHKHEAE